MATKTKTKTLLNPKKIKTIKLPKIKDFKAVSTTPKFALSAHKAGRGK